MYWRLTQHERASGDNFHAFNVTSVTSWPFEHIMVTSMLKSILKLILFEQSSNSFWCTINSGTHVRCIRQLCHHWKCSRRLLETCHQNFVYKSMCGRHTNTVQCRYTAVQNSKILQKYCSAESEYQSDAESPKHTPPSHTLPSLTSEL